MNNFQDKPGQNSSLKSEYCEKLFTTEEAAEFLRVTPGTLRNLVYLGRCPAWKLGRSLRFKMDELIPLLKKR